MALYDDTSSGYSQSQLDALRRITIDPNDPLNRYKPRKGDYGFTPALSEANNSYFRQLYKDVTTTVGGKVRSAWTLHHIIPQSMIRERRWY